MRFSIDCLKIVCQRAEKTDEGDYVVVQVVQFDGRVDSVPPQVVAQLSLTEKQDLQQFLATRKRLEAKSEHSVILEALPTLIDKVRGVLVSVEKIDERLHQKLTTAKDRLDSALSEVRTERSEVKQDLSTMNTNQPLKVQKVQLDIITRGL